MLTIRAFLVKDRQPARFFFKKIQSENGKMPVLLQTSSRFRDGGYIWAGIKGGKMHLLTADTKGNMQWNNAYEQCHVLR